MRLSPQVQANLEEIQELSMVQIAQLINQRAGRPQVAQISKAALGNQFDLIQSELNEAKAGIEAGNVSKVRDAAVDILLLVLGVAAVWENPIEEDYRLMCAYNMTRIDTNMEDALATQQKYHKLGISTIVHSSGENLFPVRTIHESQVDVDGEVYSPNKFVKSIHFEDAQYPEIDGLEIVD